MHRRLLVATAAVAALLVGCGDGGSSTSFSWTIHDSQRWGRCVVDALGAQARTETAVRTAAESCVRLLRPELDARADRFAGCAEAINASNPRATDLVYALELEACFDR